MRETEQETAGESSDKSLGLFGTANIIIGIVIGTSIFVVPGLVFHNTPNPWMGLGVWLFGGILALIGGLCYSELGACYPKAGGDYYYLTTAFGRWVGFLFGWAQLIVILPASIGVMAYVFATEAAPLARNAGVPDLDQYVGLGFAPEFYYAALAVLVVSLLNMLGVVLGKVAQNILSVAKVAGLVAIVACGFLNAKTDPAATDWTFPDLSASNWGWGSLAIILVLYAYGGWNDAAFVAGEVRNPQRNIPRALLLGIGTITVVYLLVNLAYIVGIGFSEFGQPFNPAKIFGLPQKLVHEQFGEDGATLMSVIIMISALGAVNGLIFAGSRVYAVLGNDHTLFGLFGHWTPNRGTPLLALVAQAAITLLLVVIFGTKQGHDAINGFLTSFNQTATAMAQKFDEAWVIHIDYPATWQPKDAFDALVSHSAPAFWTFFLLAGFSLFVLRDLNRDRQRPFSVPWYPLLPIIFCNMCVYMLYQSVMYIGWRSLFVVGLLLIGIPLYWLSQLLGGGRRDADASIWSNQ